MFQFYLSDCVLIKTFSSNNQTSYLTGSLNTLADFWLRATTAQFLRKHMLLLCILWTCLMWRGRSITDLPLDGQDFFLLFIARLITRTLVG
jgi:hypothetical protein